MRTLEYLQSAGDRQMLLYALLAGLGVATMCAMLSVIVVVKRLGFIGQGVSHSAFGGIGVASLLGALGLASEGGAVQMAVIVLFCLGAAIGMGAIGERRSVQMDTSIGVFLVGSMALGAVLVQVARAMAVDNGRAASVQPWESILFGSVLNSSGLDVVASCAVAMVVAGAAWLVRRPLMFWAVDEEASRAFGVPERAVKLVLMVLLSLAIVVAMRIAGVILATALLVLPGATALRLTSRWAGALVISLGVGVTGIVGGLVLSLETDWQTGPSIVLVMIGLFVVSMVSTLKRQRGSQHAATSPMA